MKTGTSHFVSHAAAVRYYQGQGEHDAEHAVKRKLAEGLIHIGQPPLKKGQRLEQDADEGRYFIVETEKWRVTYETRKPGAIGEFEDSAREVDAYDMQDAISKAFDVLHAEGLETRAPRGARRCNKG